MEKTHRLSLSIVVLVVLFASGQSFAQSDPGYGGGAFGQGHPQSVQHLPQGKLRNRIESLPPQARGRALLWLQGFSFPETDLDTLEVDHEGNVFYGDTLVPDPARAVASEGAGAPAAEAAPPATLDDAFLLHSRPGAPNVVFIDFDGDVISGTAWNGSISAYLALPYDLDGDGTTFNDTERTRIVDIWHRVAEDLAPYDIDVTTEEPAVFNRFTGHVLVTRSVDGNGNQMPSSGGGGVAYVNVFGASNYHTYYSPALVYFDNLGGGTETYVAEASSHEFGHNLGLAHDGAPGTTYYQGHGSGLVSWAPIMGNSYYNNVTEWSKGEYTDATNLQDDLAVIDGKLGYRADDHGDTPAAASALLVDPDGSVVASNPELDPHNVLTENKGVINSSGDVDVFSFVSGAGTVSLTLTPAWDAFYRDTSRRGANLDIEAELQDLAGASLDLDEPGTDTGASVTASVGAGTYFLLITGVGNAVTPYSGYASLGQYFINGSVPPPSPDTNPPVPNPMAWASVPAAVSGSAISMTAATAIDDISAVEYNFECTVGGAGCVNSGWQSSNTHTATGLAVSTSYTYQVTARDQSFNETAPSAPASATTDASPLPLAPSGLEGNGVSETVIDLTWTDNASTETSYRVERSDAGLDNFLAIAILGADASSYTDSGLNASTAYDYRVAACNGAGDSGFATASAATNDPPPYVNYVAGSDTPVAGSVSGAYTDTHSGDGATESITERESGGRKSHRYSYLEHRWNFSVSGGATATVHASAWTSGSGDGDSFDFEYSLDGGNSFSRLFSVSSTINGELQSAAIAGAPDGPIVIRVVDTDRTPGNRAIDTVHVDHLFIQVVNPSPDPPDGDPGNLAASAVSSSQIDLSWTDGSSNESGFAVDRSVDNVSWSELADLPAGSVSHSDTGLAASTRYFYRVRAHNPNGNSAFTYGDATTDPAPSLSLTADGYKAKGRHHVALDWTGPAHVDIYRDGSPIETGFAGNSYDDDTGNKGGASYTHQVCEAGTETCSNTTTTDF